jgi:hypothetical protein
MRLTVEEAIKMGYSMEILSLSNKISAREEVNSGKHPKGFPWVRVSDIPKEYLERIGFNVLPPEEAFEVKG